MSALEIYIIITGLAAGFFYLLLYPIIESHHQQKVIQNRLHIELINDLHNSMTHMDFGAIDSRTIYNPLRKSLLSINLSKASTQEGESFVLFIEKWLLEDAIKRKSSFHFYAQEAIYFMSIHPNTKYKICQWIETFLKVNPDHLHIEFLYKHNRFQLAIKKMIKNDAIINLNRYLSNLAYDNLDGKLYITKEEYLIIAF